VRWRDLRDSINRIRLKFSCKPLTPVYLPEVEMRSNEAWPSLELWTVDRDLFGIVISSDSQYSTHGFAKWLY